MNFITRRKSIDAIAGREGQDRLTPTLSWPHLVAMGVGAIVGTGIYTLTGIGAGLAGPGEMLSFLLCGIICACAAFCYAEMSTMMPAAGSAYTYTYAVLGELLAWIVGWSLILEYTIAASAVAVGWSAHVAEFINWADWPIPDALLHGVTSGGVIDLPAVIIAAIITTLLVIGTRESATVNLFLVVIKLAALVLFVVLAARAFDPARFHPFLPYGFWAHVDADGTKRGVMAAAAIIFFAFYGFDTVSTAAEETKNPGRNLTIGIIGSMVLCTLIYMAVAASALGASSFADFSKTGAPLVYILQGLKHPMSAQTRSGCRDCGLTDRHSGLDVRPEPHLLRDGPRRAAAGATLAGEQDAWNTGADDRADGNCRGRTCRDLEARSDRVACQCRDALRVYCGGALHVGAAFARAEPRACVPHAACLDHGPGMHRRLPLSVLPRAAAVHATLVPGMERCGIGGLLPIWHLVEQGRQR
jgi:amino acid permease